MHRMTLGPAFQVDAGGYYMSLLFVFLLALTFSFFSKKIYLGGKPNYGILVFHLSCHAATYLGPMTESCTTTIM